MNIPLNIDWQQILLHALNLVLLVAGLYLLLYKPVKTLHGAARGALSGHGRRR